MFRTYLLVFLFWSNFVFGQNREIAANPPEDRLNRIYKEYEKLHLSGQAWKAQVEQFEAESYLVKKGDTLWGLSKTFFGEGFYWPQLWASNPGFKNPHQIEVGDKIKFSLGSLTAPPAFLISKGVQSGAIEIPPPSKEYVPVLKTLPDTLPADPLDSSEEYNSLGFSLKVRKSPSYKAEMKLTSFYAERYPQFFGEVVEFSEARTSAGLFDHVYVEVPGARSGDRFTIIEKEARPLSTENEYYKTEVDGVVVRYLGEVIIKEEVNREDSVFRAKVTASLGLISQGSVLIRGSIPRVRFRSGRNKSVRAQVVGGEYKREREVMGMGSSIFLNAGRRSGLRVGDIVTIVANDLKRKEDTVILRGHRRIGKAQILKVENDVSTAVITDSSFAIAQGDVTL